MMPSRPRSEVTCEQDRAVADLVAGHDAARARLEDLEQALAALLVGEGDGVPTVQRQQVEGDVGGRALVALQELEAGDALVVHDDHLAVDDGLGRLEAFGQARPARGSGR